MDNWYSKALGDGVAALAPSLRIQELFFPLFAAAGQPLEMAVFSRYDRRANVVTVYFSPRAAKLASLFNASPCAMPEATGIGLLVGDQRCWDLFFPEKRRRSQGEAAAHTSF